MNILDILTRLKDEFDWNILEDKFNSRFLKYYLEKGLLKKIRDPTPGFDAIEYLLGCFDRLLILWDQNPGLKKLSESLETNEFSTVEECIKQYDAESKRLKLKINSLRKKHEWPISKWMFDVPYDFFEECILFYSFPLETINKFKWLSEYGRMYYMVKPLLQKFNSEIDVDFLLK